jgi:hypothetical protein
MNKKKVFKSFVDNIFLNALIFTFLSCAMYVFFIKNNDIELVREFDDKAFDILNYVVSTEQYDFNQKVLVFEVDNYFLKKNHLMDEDGLTNQNYGDALPRQYLIDFIKEVDKVKPKLLFVDYDLNFNTQPQIDEELIKLLRKERSYPIYFTHNKNSNFIEEKVISNNVKFVSTVLAENQDGVVRRYESFIERKNSTGKLQRYYYAPLIFANVDISKIKTSYDVTKNRFIYKDRFIDDGSIEKSYWNNIRFFSFERKIVSLKKQYTKDAIIFLGENHSNSSDIHTIYDGSEKPGIEILANSLASVYYFNPQIELLPIIPSILILCISTFIARIIFILLIEKTLSIVFFFVMAFVINTLISYFVFTFSNSWFNYNIIAYGAYIIYDVKAIWNDIKAFLNIAKKQLTDFFVRFFRQ